jgi:hypothetical protein
VINPTLSPGSEKKQAAKISNANKVSISMGKKKERNFPDWSLA